MRSFAEFSPLDRRTFLRRLSMAGVAGLVLPRGLLRAGTLAKSRVCIVEHTGATSGSSINQTIVNTMVNAGIMSLAQAGDVSNSWKALLPGVSQTSKIALKVNTLYSSLPTHPAVAMAVANSLKQMTFGGTAFPENNIIIYDNFNDKLTASGYTINTSSTGVRCFGTDAAGWFSSQVYDVAGKPQKLSKIVTDVADYLINIAVLKNHSWSGVTHCLKNHYGSCDNPSSMHETYCSPYIAALNATAPIKAKQKVNIIDALFGAISGGPEAVPQFATNRLIMSRDPVATDYQGRKLLIEKGFTYGADAYHIDVAATTYGLGTNDPNNMDVVLIQNPIPIQLVSFAFSAGALRWSTLSETNNYGFYVQRRAPDEQDFYDLPGSFVPGHGTTTQPHDYSFVDQSAGSAVWYYRLKQVDLDGTIHFTDAIRVDGPTDVQEQVPLTFGLEQNYPNPFNPSTTIRYGLPQKSHVSLTVYNAVGQLVSHLVNRNQDPGYHEVRFDGSGFPSGIYIYRLNAGGTELSRKMVYLK